jgi:hypothetical protein
VETANLYGVKATKESSPISVTAKNPLHTADELTARYQSSGENDWIYLIIYQCVFPSVENIMLEKNILIFYLHHYVWMIFYVLPMLIISPLMYGVLTRSGKD